MTGLALALLVFSAAQESFWVYDLCRNPCPERDGSRDAVRRADVLEMFSLNPENSQTKTPSFVKGQILHRSELGDYFRDTGDEFFVGLAFPILDIIYWRDGFAENEEIEVASRIRPRVVMQDSESQAAFVPINLILHTINGRNSRIVPNNYKIDEALLGLLTVECPADDEVFEIHIIECDATFSFKNAGEVGYGYIRGALFFNPGNPLCEVVTDSLLSALVREKTHLAHPKTGNDQSVLENDCFLYWP